MSRRESLLRGGDAGPAISILDPGGSLIVRRAADGSMPPINDGPQLPAADVETLKGWIKAGAKWPVGAALTPQGVRQLDPTCVKRTRIRRWGRRFRLRRIRRCR